MFYCDCRSPLKSHIDEINVLDDLNVLLNSHIYYIVVNNLLLYNKCVKQMFWNIPDFALL